MENWKNVPSFRFASNGCGSENGLRMKRNCTPCDNDFTASHNGKFNEKRKDLKDQIKTFIVRGKIIINKNSAQNKKKISTKLCFLDSVCKSAHIQQSGKHHVAFVPLPTRNINTSLTMRIYENTSPTRTALKIIELERVSKQGNLDRKINIILCIIRFTIRISNNQAAGLSKLSTVRVRFIRHLRQMCS